MSVLVAREAPDFTAAAAMPDGSINDGFKLSDLRGKHVILFFWPLDFTFVCPTEIIAMDHRASTFRDLGVEIVGISIDSQFTHHAWRNTAIEKGGIGPVTFPIVADVKHSIAQDYGIEHPDAGVAMRATFLIDKQGIVHVPFGKTNFKDADLMANLEAVVDAINTNRPPGAKGIYWKSMYIASSMGPSVQVDYSVMQK